MNAMNEVSSRAKVRTMTMRTAEHVSQGHPDKACDQFADSILDAVLDAARLVGERDASSPNHATRQRTAIEVLAKDHLVFVSGEMRMGLDVAPRV